MDLAIDRGSKVVILGLNGAGKTTLLRLLAQVDEPDTGEIIAGHGLKVGYYAQEHETLDVKASVLQNMISVSQHLTETEARKVLGSFLFTGDDVPPDGTSINFTPRAGMGVTRALDDSGTRLMVGVRWAHISNARIEGDGENPSRDSVMGYVGVIWPF